jgi:hypothetical protein
MTKSLTEVFLAIDPSAPLSKSNCPEINRTEKRKKWGFWRPAARSNVKSLYTK